MAPVTRRKARRVEAQEDGNLTVTKRQRGRPKKRLASSASHCGPEVDEDHEHRPTSTKRSARDRLGPEVSSGSERGNRHRDKEAAVEDDDDVEEISPTTSFNMQTETVGDVGESSAANSTAGAASAVVQQNVLNIGTGPATQHVGRYAATQPTGQAIQHQQHATRTPPTGPLSQIRDLRQNRHQLSIRRRDFLRASVKEVENELKDLLQSGRHKEVITSVKMDQMDQELSELRNLDLRIQEVMFTDPDQSPSALTHEMRESRLVQESALCLKREILTLVGTGREDIATGNGCGDKEEELPFKFPKVHAVKFDGSIEKWPSWWGQFRVLHESKRVSTIQKFQVLKQSLTEDSAAFQVVGQYPMEERFYEVAINELKERFGKESQLVDAIVRGTIRLITEAQEGKLTFIKFYDQLQVNLKTLETMGEKVRDQCQCLHTQIERALPQDMAARWEREKIRLSLESTGENSIHDRLSNLMKFMKTEVLVLERLERVNQMTASTVTSDSLLPTAASLASTSVKASAAKSKMDRTSAGPKQGGWKGPQGKHKNDSRDKSGCGFCGKGHPTAECFAAKEMPHGKKMAAIRKSGCCYRCLKRGHSFYECKSKVVCISCGGQHFVVLCKNLSKGPKGNQQKSSESLQSRPQKNSGQNRNPAQGIQGQARYQEQGSSGQGRHGQRDRNVQFNDGYTSLHRSQRQDQRQVQYDSEEEVTEDDLKKITRTVSAVSTSSMRSVPLQTVQLWIGGPKRGKLCRAILDTGAQKSAVTKRMVKTCGLEKVASAKVQHNLYGGATSGAIHHGIYKARLDNRDMSFSMEIELLDEDQIIEDVPVVDKISAHKLEKLGIVLSDLGEERPIDLLLGNDVFGQILTGEMKRVKSTGSTSPVVAICTQFGWVLSGSFGTLEGNEVDFPAVAGALSLNQLFELDSLGIKDPVQTKSKKDVAEDAKAYFQKTVQRDETGRYSVEWPWMREKNLLPNNFSVAKARLVSATKKLREGGLYQQYNQVFEEWLADGIIEEVSADGVERYGFHYLPHRGVVKLDSLTTKLRPVFDASCRTNSTYSLNDLLTKGPNMLEMIPDLIMRMRLGKVAAVADIKKAFLQIDLHEDQRDVVRFLWWDDQQQNIRVFRHKRVVFGVNCSPFLLAAVLEKHLREVPAVHKSVARKLLESLYVDNAVASFDSSQQYLKFRETSVKLLAEAKFDLRLWESNLDPEPREVTKVLGIQWNKQEDTLAPSIAKVKVPEHLTRRIMLAVAHSLFDPIGVLTPVAIVPKQLFREATMLGLGWNDPLPDILAKKFRRWCQEVATLKKVSIPRMMAEVNPSNGNWSLHIFCDASQTAFATVAFVRVETPEGVTVRFLQSRSRLAPVKEKATIPRLELLGCAIGARLAKSIKEALQMDWPTIYWTDSMTALQWIQSSEIWGVFVDNRVKEIRRLSKPEEWRHVPGKANPADIPSRGLTPKKFLESNWLNGPEWLKMGSENWPKEDVRLEGHFRGENRLRNFHEEVLEERRKSTTLTTTTVEVPQDQEPMEVSGDVQPEDQETPMEASHWFEKANTYTEILKVLAREISGKSEEPTQEELGEAEIQAWKWVQEETKVSDKLKKPLKVELRDGLWCVNTRLSFREDCNEFLWPVYLPCSHPLVRMLIKETHERLSHAGPGIVNAELRKRVWIQRGRQTANVVISKCIPCRIQGAKKMTATEAPLPKKRVTLGRVFETTGVDFGGPLYTRSGEKVYFALFTCATYRAIHLELVGDLSTEAFVQAFRRFRNRRGNPKIVCSDNGTNFRGFENIMEKIDWAKIKQEFQLDRIKWDFNPPASPWWGGFWERLVGLVKRLLRRILGDRVLDKEELRTALTDVESVVNSRPLTYLGEKDGLIPLTPNSFLMDVPWAEVPDVDAAEEYGFQQRFQYRQKLREELRQRFRLEYLGSLRSDSSSKKHEEIKLNDFVLIELDSKKRVAWPIAQVVELIPGRDGVTRLVKLKTQSGELFRPIQRLVRLGTELLPAQAKGLQKVVIRPPRKSQVQHPDPVPPQQINNYQDIEQDSPVDSITRSGRVSRQPDRLMYALAGFEIFE